MPAFLERQAPTHSLGELSEPQLSNERNTGRSAAHYGGTLQFMMQKLRVIGYRGFHKLREGFNMEPTLQVIKMIG